MPRNPDIKKVLVIGSGPIVIGQAAEFDYSGTQACEALKEEGVEVVLVNSNPATIMTDTGLAHYTYIEPLTIPILEKIIAKERPDSVIAGMGGQTGLNLSCELHDRGILAKYDVSVIGTSIASIKEGEDRESFKKLMERIGEPIVESVIVNEIESGVKFATEAGYPVVVRPAYTLGGTGGGLAENEDELREILALGLQLSRVGQALVERSIKGWKEIEFEVIRDSAGNCIAVCSMENIDPVGVHTGDSIVVAPAQTLADKEYQMLRNSAINIINSIEIVGGCNVQFALEPNSFEYAVIEINPRVSRSSALASKATGYPIAKVAAKIALGLRLDEIVNAVTGQTFAFFEPVLDYVVLKIPKWPFDKFHRAKRTLGTKMMATGEIMAIGNSLEHAIMKGVRSLEINQYTLEHKASKDKSIEELKRLARVPEDERLFHISEMLRRNYRMEKICEITGMDPFFLHKIKNIVDWEEDLKDIGLQGLTPELMRFYKENGFSDKGMAELLSCTPEEVFAKRTEWGIHPVYKMVDTCAGTFEADSSYYYSTYDTDCETVISDKRKVLVIGSGPIRIGQGIEFDYCSVHCVASLKRLGIETIIINNNPETVSTDFDTADKLYFEPLSDEDVYEVILKEKPDGVILQFGGQTAIKLAGFLSDMNVPIYGTKPKQIDVAEDREKFDELLERLDILRPKGRGIWTIEEGMKVADELAFPLLVRPSYVLGGQGMEITVNREELRAYLSDAFKKDSENPVLVDRYLGGREIEVDVICDGDDVLIPGIMEHLEKAGIHSGDSISIYPPQNVSSDIKERVLEVTRKVAKALEVVGMVNIQFIEFEGELYIIEVNPRSSRTVPYISKVTGVPIIDLATRAMLGEKLADMGFGVGLYPEADMVSVKVPIFSTEKLPQVEAVLGPEMRSTGEVLGLGRNIKEALYKGFIASGSYIPKSGGTILATLRQREQENFVPLAKRFAAMGCRFMATEGTAKVLMAHGIEVTEVKKIGEGVPNILDIIRSGVIDLVIDIPSKSNDINSDAFKIRRGAIESQVDFVTSLDTAAALADVMESGLSVDGLDVFDINRL